MTTKTNNIPKILEILRRPERSRDELIFIDGCFNDIQIIKDAHLSLDLRLELFRQMTCDVFKPGKLITKEGDIGDTAYIMLSGVVNVYKQTPGEGQKHVHTQRAWDAIGHLALRNNAPRAATCRAMSEVPCAVIPRDLYQMFLKASNESDVHEFIMHSFPGSSLQDAVNLSFCFKSITVKAGTRLTTRGQAATQLLLIKRGLCAVVSESAGADALAENDRRRKESMLLSQEEATENALKHDGGLLSEVYHNDFNEQTKPSKIANNKFHPSNYLGFSKVSIPETVTDADGRPIQVIVPTAPDYQTPKEGLWQGNVFLSPAKYPWTSRNATSDPLDGVKLTDSCISFLTEAKSAIVHQQRSKEEVANLGEIENEHDQSNKNVLKDEQIESMTPIENHQNDKMISEKASEGNEDEDDGVMQQLVKVMQGSLKDGFTDNDPSDDPAARSDIDVLNKDESKNTYFLRALSTDNNAISSASPYHAKKNTSSPMTEVKSPYYKTKSHFSNLSALSSTGDETSKLVSSIAEKQKSMMKQWSLPNLPFIKKINPCIPILNQVPSNLSSGMKNVPNSSRITNTESDEILNLHMSNNNNPTIQVQDSTNNSQMVDSTPSVLNSAIVDIKIHTESAIREETQFNENMRFNSSDHHHDSSINNNNEFIVNENIHQNFNLTDALNPSSIKNKLNQSEQNGDPINSESNVENSINDQQPPHFANQIFGAVNPMSSSKFEDMLMNVCDGDEAIGSTARARRLIRINKKLNPFSQAESAGNGLTLSNAFGNNMLHGSTFHGSSRGGDFNGTLNSSGAPMQQQQTTSGRELAFPSSSNIHQKVKKLTKSVTLATLPVSPIGSQVINGDEYKVPTKSANSGGVSDATTSPKTSVTSRTKLKELFGINKDAYEMPHGSGHASLPTLSIHANNSNNKKNHDGNNNSGISSSHQAVTSILMSRSSPLIVGDNIRFLKKAKNLHTLEAARRMLVDTMALHVTMRSLEYLAFVKQASADQLKDLERLKELVGVWEPYHGDLNSVTALLNQKSNSLPHVNHNATLQSMSMRNLDSHRNYNHPSVFLGATSNFGSTMLMKQSHMASTINAAASVSEKETHNNLLQPHLLRGDKTSITAAAGGAGFAATLMRSHDHEEINDSATLTSNGNQDKKNYTLSSKLFKEPEALSGHNVISLLCGGSLIGEESFIFSRIVSSPGFIRAVQNTKKQSQNQSHSNGNIQSTNNLSENGNIIPSFPVALYEHTIITTTHVEALVLDREAFARSVSFPVVKQLARSWQAKRLWRRARQSHLQCEFLPPQLVELMCVESFARGVRYARYKDYPPHCLNKHATKHGGVLMEAVENRICPLPPAKSDLDRHMVRKPEEIMEEKEQQKAQMTEEMILKRKREQKSSNMILKNAMLVEACHKSKVRPKQSIFKHTNVLSVDLLTDPAKYIYKIVPQQEKIESDNSGKKRSLVAEIGIFMSTQEARKQHFALVHALGTSEIKTLPLAPTGPDPRGKLNVCDDV